jgi:hypothetical protein
MGCGRRVAGQRAMDGTARIAWWARRQACVRLLVWAAMVLAAAWAATPATLARSVAPPRAERLNPTPTPSGAEAAYPLNHVLDGESTTTGTPPANFDFEAASTSTGTPPANSTFAAAATETGTPPSNGDFEATPDFTGWTTSGTVSIQTDMPHGRYATLGLNAVLTSSAVTVDAAATSFLFEFGSLTGSTTTQVKVFALSGAGYSTETLLGEFKCAACAGWETALLDATAYQGQSVKLKFQRLGGDAGIDRVRQGAGLPSWMTAGAVTRANEADGNAFAALSEAGTLTSSAFTVASDAQGLTLRLKGLTTGSDQYKVFLLSGPTYGTNTQLGFTTAADTWTTLRYDAGGWLGQSVKLKVQHYLGRVAVDDAGVQQIDLPSWTVTADTTRVTGGPSGAYARTNGQLTSGAVTLAADVQQLSVAHKGDAAGSSFYLELLRGADFSQVVDLSGNVIGDQTQWKTLKVGVSARSR